MEPPRFGVELVIVTQFAQQIALRAGGRFDDGEVRSHAAGDDLQPEGLDARGEVDLRSALNISGAKVAHPFEATEDVDDGAVPVFPARAVPVTPEQLGVSVFERTLAA